MIGAIVSFKICYTFMPYQTYSYWLEYFENRRNGM